MVILHQLYTSMNFSHFLARRIAFSNSHIHITDTNINRTFEQVPINKNAEYIEEIKDIGQLKYSRWGKAYAPICFGTGDTDYKERIWSYSPQGS